MSNLPRITAAQLIRALERGGFYRKRQTGSHATFAHRDDPTRRATVPVHAGHIIEPKVMKAILAGAQLSTEELVDLLR